MKITLAFLLLVAVSGCASGVSTGRKSDCFGKMKPDGTYLPATINSQNAYAPSFSFVGTKGRAPVANCDFHWV